jgi:hypothetical protein
MRSDDIVRLVTAPNPFVAHAWQQALEEQGIRAQVVGDYLEAGVGNMPGLTAEVWVHRDDVTRAQEILRQGQEAAAEGEPEA